MLIFSYPALFEGLYNPRYTCPPAPLPISFVNSNWWCSIIPGAVVAATSIITVDFLRNIELPTCAWLFPCSIFHAFLNRILVPKALFIPNLSRIEFKSSSFVFDKCSTVMSSLTKGTNNSSSWNSWSHLNRSKAILRMSAMSIWPEEMASSSGVWPEVESGG